jgi:hypothetical protein
MESLGAKNMFYVKKKGEEHGGENSYRLASFIDFSPDIRMCAHKRCISSFTRKNSIKLFYALCEEIC